MNYKKMGRARSFLKFVHEDRIDVLENGMLRLTPPRELNDPFEVNPIIFEMDHDNLYSSVQADHTNMNDSDREYTNYRHSCRKLYRDKYQEFVNDFGILSLTSNDFMTSQPSIVVVDPMDPMRNLLMWAHYANEHKGFLIEFSSDFMEATHGITHEDIKPVSYSNERPILLFEDVEMKKMDPFYIKGDSWQYENEWRIVLPLTSSHTVKENNIHLYKFNRKSILSVICGCKMSKENKTRIRKIMKDPDLGYPAYYEAELDNEHTTVIIDSYSGDDYQWTNNQPFGNEMIYQVYNQFSPETIKSKYGK
ncbi:DUF2971 domain-containing protein [Providencia rettgeri]